jgi:hypothetical protein
VQDLSNTDDSYWVRNFSQELKVRIPTGHSLLIGGWETEPGRRAFVLTGCSKVDEAEKETAAENANIVSVVGLFVELSETAARELGLTEFLAEGVKSSSQLLMPKEEADDLLNRIKNKAGSNILSPPKITTFSGKQGIVSVEEPFASPNGHSLQTGPRLDVLPNITADFAGIDLVLKAEINLRTQNEVPKP